MFILEKQKEHSYSRWKSHIIHSSSSKKGENGNLHLHQQGTLKSFDQLTIRKVYAMNSITICRFVQNICGFRLLPKCLLSEPTIHLVLCFSLS